MSGVPPVILVFVHIQLLHSSVDYTSVCGELDSACSHYSLRSHDILKYGNLIGTCTLRYDDSCT